ncbi:hypothetical protein AGMMS50229_19720 [Campylobacterota bacterium]|nr:hypothetical protein AGMMS50229_19720 [Campylobacterota bacterium]
MFTDFLYGFGFVLFMLILIFGGAWLDIRLHENDPEWMKPKPPRENDDDDYVSSFPWSP